MEKNKHNIDSSDIDEIYPIIIFNDRILPRGAVFIDFLASGHFFDDIDDETSKWFWHFTICIGRTLFASSKDVIKHATALKSLLINNSQHVKSIMRQKYEQENIDHIYKWWLETLIIMICTAENREISSWHGMQGIPQTSGSKGSGLMPLT